MHTAALVETPVKLLSHLRRLNCLPLCATQVVSTICSSSARAPQVFLSCLYAGVTLALNGLHTASQTEEEEDALPWLFSHLPELSRVHLA